MSLPIQIDGHKLQLQVNADNNELIWSISCPGRAECAMEPWPPPDGERTAPCYLQYNLDELGMDCIEGMAAFEPITIKWRIDGSGEDSELWVDIDS